MTTYDAEYGGKTISLEAKSKDEVKAYLDQKYSEECEFNGEGGSDTAYILTMNEECEEIAREEYVLSYEIEKSEYEEHNLNYRGGFL